MLLIQNDTISVKNPLTYVLLLLSMIGTFDIMSEIADDNAETVTLNFTKKIVLWAAIYLQTKSIFYTSLISSCIVLSFPRVFFGKQSGPRFTKLCEQSKT